MSRNLQLGKYGEELAAQFLERNNFQVFDRNFRTRWGEIDLIARRGGHVHFVEVKTRAIPNYGEPEEAIHRFKKKRLLGAAKMYVATHFLPEEFYQIDSVSIFINKYSKKAHVRYYSNIVLEGRL